MKIPLRFLSPIAPLAAVAAVACSGGSSSSTSAPDTHADAGGASPVLDASLPDADAAPAPACSPTDPRTPPITLTVEPDDGQTPIANVVASAQQSIRVMIYDFGPGEILTTVVQKAQAGVKVQAILDQTQQSSDQTAYNELTAAGAQVKWSNPVFTYTHAKTIVVDGVIAVISTGNFEADMEAEERDFVMVDSDPQDVTQLASIFDNDWNDTTPNLSCTRLVVSPVNSEDRILAVINGATKSLDIESLEFSDTAVQNAVAAQQKAGVAVRVLLADMSFESDIMEAVNEIEPMGLVPRRLVTPQLHLKSILADGTTAYAGSENMSNTSLTQNREVGLIVTEPAAIATMAATFASDWGASLPFPSDDAGAAVDSGTADSGAPVTDAAPALDGAGGD
jgi:phosphatidylserine/phosphatidylglycerophosphate/cardiolipin synthase-like enzyme